ncbi:MAG TPA: ROK family protein [Chitinophagaceae bacterium]|nr:ROK family protein [Chitinophagaceae bacterium]
MQQPVFIGVDIGGSHISAARIDMNTAIVMDQYKVRESVNTQAQAAEIIETWTAAIRKVAIDTPSDAIHLGIAMPGPFDYNEGISGMKDQGKYDSLFGLNVRVLLADALNMPAAQIFFMNDAACFLQGEMFGGAGRGKQKAIGLTLGTGLGSAWYEEETGAVDADLWRSPFKTGIAEDYLSSRWFISCYYQLSGRKVGNVKELLEQRPDDKNVDKVLDIFAVNLAAFLLPLIKEKEADVVLLGGNISRAYDLFSGTLIDTLLQNDVDICIQQAEDGETAAMLGAAHACMKHTCLPGLRVI